MTDHLFSPLKIKDITLRNRIGVSPMCQYWSEDGHASDWHLVHLGSRAVGGAGLIIAEATAVEARGRISPGDAGLWKDSQIEPLVRITQFLKKYGAVPGIQLAHAGRKGSASRPWEGDKSLSEEEGGWPTIGPSAIAFGKSLTKAPKEMTQEDIDIVKESFRKATIRALSAGYEWLEFHAAHGYLAHSFYSPLSNKRQDQYGGSFENRIRFTLETAEVMRKEWPDKFPFSVRISASDWIDGGWTLEDSIGLAKELKKRGVDLIDCSSGANSPDARYPLAPGWQVPLAEGVKKGAQILTSAVGMISEPKQADEIIREQKADLVFLATEMLRDPYWPLHAAKALGQTGEGLTPPPYDYVVSGRRAAKQGTQKK